MGGWVVGWGGVCVCVCVWCAGGGGGGGGGWGGWGGSCHIAAVVKGTWQKNACVGLVVSCPLVGTRLQAPTVLVHTPLCSELAASGRTLGEVSAEEVETVLCCGQVWQLCAALCCGPVQGLAVPGLGRPQG